MSTLKFDFLEGARLLIVDDHPLILSAFTNLAASYGIDVFTSESIESVIASDMPPPTIVALDLNLGGINGFDGFPLIKSKFPDAKIVIVTGSDRQSDCIKAKAIGANGYICKHCSRNELMLAFLSIALVGRCWPENINDAVGQNPSNAQEKIADEIFPEIMGSFCHDLGNTLLELEALSDECSERMRERISRAVGQLDSMHKFTRLFYSTSKLNEIDSNIPLNDLLKKTLERELIGSKIHVRVKVDDVSRRIDAVLVDRIISPIIRNAIERIESIGQGGVDCALNISATLFDEEDVLEISVDNIGGGFLSHGHDILKGIRSGTPFSTKGEGRGNGLIHAYRICKFIGGDLRFFDSEDGRAYCVVQIPVR